MNNYLTTDIHPWLKKGLKVEIKSETKPTHASINHINNTIEVCKYQFDSWMESGFIKDSNENNINDGALSSDREKVIQKYKSKKQNAFSVFANDVKGIWGF